MTTYTEGNANAEFVLSVASGTRSLETVTLISGQNLAAGTVLGQITVGSATSAAGTNTGNGTMGTVTVSTGAKPGAYKLVVVEPATDAGKFVVEDPDGIIIGTGAVASAFSAGGLAFTLADGSTDFVSGDSFTITVAAGSGKYTLHDPATPAANGSQHAAAILYADCDASGGDKSCVVIARDAEVKSTLLTWHGSANSGHKTTATALLATKGIILRT